MCSDVEPPDGLAGLAAAAEVELEESGYLKVTGTNGSVISSSRPGVFVAGCASGPKNIKDSLMEAQTAADSASAQLDPRLLQPEGGDSEGGEPKKAAQASPDDLRAQLEQLLNALINR
jgi:heterodisulfide reductase subunit A-like polyferredoxin